jgi:transcriptional regulator with XRE-family HTH domain
MNAKQIKNKITEIGIKQKKIAELAGCNAVHLNGALNGTKDLSESLRMKLIEVLKKFN